MLFKLLRLPVTGPVEGVAWVAAQIAKEADRELYSEERIMAELADLHRQLDAGHIDEETFRGQEDVLLDRLAAARGHETVTIDNRGGPRE